MTDVDTLTLAEFLLARIAEDIEDQETRRWATAHIDRFDPARVMTECEAKWKIIELHETIAAGYPGCTIETDPCCRLCSMDGEYPARSFFPCKTLRLLAAIYVDHPDYRDEWKP